MKTKKDGDESRATLGPGDRPGEPLEPLERQRGTDTLDDQRNRLSRLRGFEEQLRTLRECELEVERIATVKREHKVLHGEVEGGREQVFRFLSRQGRAPVDGHADLEALDAGPKRVAKQPPTVVPTDPSNSGTSKR